jgi:uncharacterized protein (TIGR02246 family)
VEGVTCINRAFRVSRAPSLDRVATAGEHAQTFPFDRASVGPGVNAPTAVGWNPHLAIHLGRRRMTSASHEGFAMSTVTRQLVAGASALLLASAVSAQAKPQGQPGTAKPASSSVAARAGVRKSLEAYRTALLAGDPKGMAALTTDDVVVVEFGQPDIRGRAGVEAFATNVFKKLKIVQMELVTDELTVRDSVASELGREIETVQEAGKAPVHQVGVYLINWKREADGVWRIQRVMEHPKP